jgi:hypothetical protein
MRSLLRLLHYSKSSVDVGDITRSTIRQATEQYTFTTQHTWGQLQLKTYTRVSAVPLQPDIR